MPSNLLANLHSGSPIGILRCECRPTDSDRSGRWPPSRLTCLMLQFAFPASTCRSELYPSFTPDDWNRARMAKSAFQPDASNSMPAWLGTVPQEHNRESEKRLPAAEACFFCLPAARRHTHSGNGTNACQFDRSSTTANISDHSGCVKLARPHLAQVFQDFTQIRLFPCPQRHFRHKPQICCNPLPCLTDLPPKRSRLR